MVLAGFLGDFRRQKPIFFIEHSSDAMSRPDARLMDLNTDRDSSPIT